MPNDGALRSMLPVLAKLSRNHTSKLQTSMRIGLRRGRLELQRASALITSANDALVGNLQPEYWRFEGGINVDGALRAKAGPDLIDACLALPVLDTEGKRDLVRWTRAVKIGESSLVRCPTGSAEDGSRFLGGCHNSRRGAGRRADLWAVPQFGGA